MVYGELGDLVRHDYEEEKERDGTASFPSSLFNLLNTILGGGILALPQAFSMSGLLVGVIFTFFVGILSAISSTMLVEVSDKLGDIRSYKDLANRTFGTFGGFIIDICLVLFLFGTMTGYIVIIADLLTPSVVNLFNLNVDDRESVGYDYIDRIFVSGVVTGCVLLPVSMLPKIDFLKYTSTVALICIVYMVITVSVITFRQLINNLVLSDVLWGNFGIDSFAAMPVIVFSFSFHTALFPIKNEMKEPEKITTIVTTACLISGTMYITVGMLGYLTFLDCTDSNVLVNFDTSLPITISKFALVVVLCFSYPLMSFACRVSVWNLLFPLSYEASCWDSCPMCIRKWKGRGDPRYNTIRDGDIPIDAFYDSNLGSPASKRNTITYQEVERQKVSLPLFIFITIILTLGAWVLSVAVPDISAIFGLVGSTAGSIVVFIFPGAAVLKVDGQEDGVDFFDRVLKMEVDDQPQEKKWSLVRIRAWVFVIIGCMVACLGTFVSLYNWGKDFGGTCTP
jgi:amino acid permease